MPTMDRPDDNQPKVQLSVPTGLSLEKSLSYRSRCDELDAIAADTSISIYKRLELMTTLAKNAVGLYISSQQVAANMAKQEFGTLPLDGLG